MTFKRALHLAAQAAVVVVSASYGSIVLAAEAKATKLPQKTEGSCDSSDGTCISTTHLDECGIWLAPSSLPGAGLGIFAGRNFTKHEPMQQSGDVVIPIVDIMMHQRGRGKFSFLWDEYTWNGKSLGIGHEVIKECNAASPGFGAAANSFLDLVNVEEHDPQNTMPNGLHRSKDPGVGAFSTYHDRKATARFNIVEGQELFVNYGQHWFEQRSRLGPIPLRRGLKQSTGLYSKFKELREDNPTVDNKVYDVLWGDFVKNTVWNESRILGAFMHTPLERKMLDLNFTLKQVRVTESIRSSAWLKEHGSCADHLQEGVSTIRQAGRGAFATRALPKGAAVGPLPIIQIVDKSVLEMYKLVDIKNKKRERRIITGYQLIVNYCYGHSNSTMLLCPYGPLVNLVNHNQTRANVRLEWADAERGNHVPDLLDVFIEEFAEDRTAKLALDMVATRDIQPGEEVFLDYGDVYEKAWQEHVKTWKVKGADKYVSAFMLNGEKAEVLRTEFEQLTNRYPGNINIECDNGIWNRIDKTLFETHGEVNITKPDKHEWWVCDILQYRFADDGSIRYTVVVTRPEEKKKKKKQANDKKDKPKEKYLKLSDIPRMALRFTDRPYTSDMFLKEAFRHSIMIPNDMWPTKWMNFSPV